MTHDLSGTLDPVPFSSWLKQQRQQHGLTQVALARQLGYSVAMVRAMEYGKRRPSPQIVNRLLESLPLPPTEQVFLQRLIEDSSSKSQSQATSPFPIPTAANPLPPLPLTPLIGQDQLIAHLQTKILDPQTRLLTLTGPPGVGKTRVALQLAHMLHDQFYDEVWFIALAPLQDPDLLLPTIAQNVGIAVPGNQSVLQTVQTAFHNRKMCLILDNCEHLLTVAPLLTDLLSAAPQLTIVVTSRAILRVAGEQVVVVPPLQLPHTTDTLESLVANPAVQLFIKHAQAVNADWHHTNTDVPVITHICRMLDGLPLAIAVVAAHSRLYPPHLLAELLDDTRLDMVNPVQRIEERHLSLRAAIAWGYEHLTSLEQHLFVQLSVFVGGATIEAIKEVCADSILPSSQIITTLEGLIDKSLIQCDNTPDAPTRIVLLETLRTYAHECLMVQEHHNLVHTRHAQYYGNRMVQMEQLLKGPERAECSQWMQQEYANIRAALQWALGQQSLVLAGHIAVGLRTFWVKGGYLDEGRRLLAALLQEDKALPTPLYAKLLQQDGILAYAAGNYAVSHDKLIQSLSLSRTEQDVSACATTLYQLGGVCSFQGRYDAAVAYYQEALELYQSLDDIWGIAGTLNGLGVVVFNREDPTQARYYHAQSLKYAQQLQNSYGEAITKANLGLVALYEGDYSEAQQCFRESRALSTQMNESLMTTQLIGEEGKVACRAGNYDYAMQCFREGLMLWQSLGLYTEVVDTLQGIAELLATHGATQQATWLLGATTALRTRCGLVIHVVDRHPYADLYATLEQDLGAERFRDWWSKGEVCPPHDLLPTTQAYLMSINVEQAR